MLGAFARYKMIVNVIGSLTLSLFSVLANMWNLDSRYSLFAAVGFCGSLTTMSSFALETTVMIGKKQFGNVAINILANLGLSIGAIFGGRAIPALFAKG